MSRSRSLRIAPGQRFSCHQCARCCRRWHVALNDEEINRLRRLKWDDDPQVPAAVEPVVRINGQPFLAHRANGDCIYLDPETLQCRVETRFGRDAKPYGCRLFPWDVSLVLPGVVSCGTRFDCPSVQRNQGALLTAQQDEIRRLTRERDRPEPAAAGRPNTQAVIAVAEWLADLAVGDPTTSLATSALAVSIAAEHAAKLDDTLLNNAATARQFLATFRDQFRERAAAALAAATLPGGGDRVLFRLSLANHLRRDEEILHQPGTRRVRRFRNAVAIISGGGNLRGLGAEHPDVALSRVRLFAADRRLTVAPGGRECWERYFTGRLHTLRFFGPDFGGVDCFRGARILAALLPLVVATATAHAVAAGREAELAAPDVEYAVGAVDHASGRNPLLQQSAQQFIARRFSDPAALASLFRGLGL